MEDRLSELPDALKLRILARLNTKHAVQTSMLLKSWGSLWTWLPVLKLDCFDLYNEFHTFDTSRMFEKFVIEILCGRHHLAKLDTLKFSHIRGCSVGVLKSVFDHAFSHGVENLDAYALVLNDGGWPILVLPCDSLSRLKLQSATFRSRVPFLGPGSKLFKNLTFLYIINARITDDEPFSGFRVLKKLILIYCFFSTRTLRVHALRLSDLTVFNTWGFFFCELRTPRLRVLKYEGPVFSTYGNAGLNVLRTLKINIVSYRKETEKQMFDDLISLFSGTLPSVKSVTLSSPIVHILFLFPDEFVSRGSPFRRLKDLKLDLSCHRGDYPDWFESPSRESIEYVKTYLLHNSPNAKLTITNRVLV